MKPIARSSTSKSSKSKEETREKELDIIDIDIGVEPIADEYPYGTRLLIIVISLILAFFLVALDNVSFVQLFTSTIPCSQQSNLDHPEHGHS